MELEDNDALVGVLGVDPSLLNLGIAFGVIDLKNEVVTIYAVDTFYIKLLVNFDKGDNQFGLSNRSRQVKEVKNLIMLAIKQFKPDMVVTEEPVFGCNASSLKNQMESIAAIRLAVIESDINEDLIIYYPGTIKKTVNASGKDKASLKESITNGLIDLIGKTLVFDKPTLHHPSLLDEHSNDAIAMVLTKAKELFEFNQDLFGVNK